MTGGLHWADAADAAHATGLQRTMRQLLEWGARVDRLTPAQVTAELEPDLRIDPDRVADVYLVDRAGWVDPVAMAHGTMSAAVRRYGARLVHAEVVGPPASRRHDRGGGPRRRIGAGRGHRRGRGRAGRRPRSPPSPASPCPCSGRRACSSSRDPPRCALRRVVYAGEVHLRPEGGARLMVQWDALDTDVLDGSTLGPDGPRVAEAMSRARAVVPGLAEVGPEAVRIGVRPVPKDGYPLVGFDTTIVNLYHVVTHSGITLSARLASLVTEELTGGDTAPLDPYRPARFAGRPGPGAAAVTAGAGAAAQPAGE